MVNWATPGPSPWSTLGGGRSQDDGTRKQVQKKRPSWYVIAGQALLTIMGRLRSRGIDRSFLALSDSSHKVYVCSVKGRKFGTTIWND